MLDIDLLVSLGASYRKLAAGEIIFKEGGLCNFYYQLVEGQVKWVNINEDGKEYLYNLIDPGECFGEIPLFDEGLYAATAIAEEDSIIIKLHKTTFHKLLVDQPEIHMSFSKLLAKRLRFKFFLLRELLYNKPEERVVSLMEYMKKNHYSVCDSCGKVKLTRQQIANITCLRVETVIRTIKRMEEKGIVTIRKGKVYMGL